MRQLPFPEQANMAKLEPKFRSAVGEQLCRGVSGLTNSATESPEAVQDSPFVTRVAHGRPKKEICQNNNSAIPGGFWLFTLLPWERMRLSLNSSLEAV